MATFEKRWRTLLAARAKSAVGLDPTPGFVYAVLTTGVYCRPGCRSRLPLRDNVLFFESSLAARHAGYRPCKRCQPDGQRLARYELVERACRLIETSDPPPSLEAQARAVGLSPSRFHKLFKATLGVTPKRYAAAHQRGQLQSALAAGQTVTRAIHDARYSSASRVYEHSNDLLGMAPSAYARGGEGEAIAFAVAPCSLGRVLVATTQRGICAVELGASEQALVRSLNRRFPRAEKGPLRGAGRRVLAAVLRRLDGPAGAKGPELPLDIRGSAFQQRVWAALSHIPQGQTVTYSDLAHQLGAPLATRAVASACAANGLAVLVPCHRVVRKDGGLGGYRWGVSRKKALLRREAAHSANAGRAVAKARQ